MKLKRILALLQSGTFFQFVFSRFRTVRQLYSFLKKFGSQSLPQGLNTVTLFPNIQANKAAEELDRDAVAFGFDLSPEDVEEIQSFAKSTPCRRGGLDQEFLYGDVSNGRLPNGTPVALGRVNQPKKCSAINRIAKDPTLWNVCRRYLGYTPKTNDIRLF